MATKKKTATVQTKGEKTSISHSSKSSGNRDRSKRPNASSAARKKRTASASGKQTKGKKKTSSGTKSNTSRHDGINVPDISREKGTPLSAEIFLWFMLAFCILFFLGNTFQAGGIVGKAISGCFFGLFGRMAYGMPFFLFLITTLLIANRGCLQAWIKAIAALVLVISLSCFFAMVSNPVSSQISPVEYYRSCMENKNGGGMAGAAVYRLFYPIAGEIGTWICNTVLFIIGMILLTGHTLFDSIYSESENAIGQAHTRKKMRRELNRQRKKRVQLQKQVQMQREIEEMKTANQEMTREIQKPRRLRVVKGVSTNTTFGIGLPVAEEIHEVVPKIQNSSGTTSMILDPGKAKASEESVPETPSRQKKPKIIQTDAERTAIMEKKKEESFPKMQFTIQRNGSSQVISSVPVTEAVREVEPAVTVSTDPASGKEQVPLPQGKKHIREENKKILHSKEEQEQAAGSVADEIKQDESAEKEKYVFPPLDLLKKPSGFSEGNNNDEVAETARKLQDTLHSFGVNVTVTNVSCGPAVTRYELQPEQGVKVSKIVNLADDIKLNLAAEDVRIEAPIPGKAAVGIEVPNKVNSAVYLRELLESDEFRSAKSNLSFAVGKDIAGKVVITDIAKMPHLLIAGATGSGKSVCINTLIMSIIYKADPEDVKLIMIDPKVVELSVYNGIPHLFIPVVTDPKKASGALNWGVAEMTKRYELFASAGVRDLKGYNAKVEALDSEDVPDKPKKLPQIVIIVDELADLMMVAPGEVEDAICRLAQLARAAGIHLIIATQRPSVNVITGLIKANMPSRIAFSVTSGVDSRTILDMTGAEKLLGKGDMLFYPQGYSKPVRIQGSFVSDAEVSRVTKFLTQKNDMAAYHKQMETRMNTVAQSSLLSTGDASDGSERDSNFVQAGKFIIEKDKASIGMLQRVFKIGFNRAARIMDQLSEAGVVGPEEGTKPRKVLMSMEEFEQYIHKNI